MNGRCTILLHPNAHSLEVPKKKKILYKCGNAAQHLILPLELAASTVGAKLFPPNEHHQPRTASASNGPTANLLFQHWHRTNIGIYFPNRSTDIYRHKATARVLMNFPEQIPNINEDKDKVTYREQQWKKIMGSLIIRVLTKNDCFHINDNCNPPALYVGLNCIIIQ